MNIKPSPTAYRAGRAFGALFDFLYSISITEHFLDKPVILITIAVHHRSQEITMGYSMGTFSNAAAAHSANPALEEGLILL
jgi:hypothetical protein